MFNKFSIKKALFNKFETLVTKLQNKLDKEIEDIEKNAELQKNYAFNRILEKFSSLNID